MVIFLAAVLDVPQHLYESAELDGAGPLQRLRWVTLPTISPVILFAVVLGVIQGLQYFTQAYVAASVASGQASQAGRRRVEQPRLPAGLDALLSRAPLPARVQRLPDGLRVGDGDAAARRLLRGDARDRPQLAQVGPPGGAAVTATAAPSAPAASTFVRRRPPRGPAQAVPGLRREPQRADRRRDRVPRAVRVHHADVADDERTRRCRPSSGRIRSASRTSSTSSRRRRCWRWTLNTLLYSGLATLGVRRLVGPGRLRARAPALARARTSRS